MLVVMSVKGMPYRIYNKECKVYVLWLSAMEQADLKMKKSVEQVKS